MNPREIIIENAFENNLKNVSLRIPHYQLVVVTGVSGSGKSSLIDDVLGKEGRRLFLENFAGSRFHQSIKLSRPDASSIQGLFPVVFVSQNNVVRSPRSTVGTLTELYDYLRLLFARLGTSPDKELKINRSLFSPNMPAGYCPVCKGLGVEDHIDPDLIIGDPTKTLREGALTLTTPNGYIIYSQVTMDVLDEVCRSEGFNVDIPWNELTAEQQRIVLYGSDKIKILFGKHTLESRLRWTGITAKPREEGYYKGIIPVMEEILKRDRNANIMRFARSFTCPACSGKKLNDKALSVTLWGKSICHYSAMSIRNLHDYFSQMEIAEPESAVLNPIREAILRRTELLIKLGLGYLSCDRESVSLRGGEGQRIKLAVQAASGLRNILYILDEPSAGLHPSEQKQLLDVLRTLVNSGNTVIAVDHDEQTIRNADWIIDIGPGAGDAGGEIIFNGKADDFFRNVLSSSITQKYLLAERKPGLAKPEIKDRLFCTVRGANTNNLKNIDAAILMGGFNVVTGVSGSGKSSFVNFLRYYYHNVENKVFKKIIHIDSTPIGRTPKSNPATYTGMSDHIRDIMASLCEAKAKGYKKGQFSFVVKGGRCEACGGAGVQQTGMHFLGNVDVICEVCSGKRFTEETLKIRYKGKNIAEILSLTVDEAHDFFKGNQKITNITSVLSDLGLGYLKLGQPSTTLSGGEAQRVKMASELARTSTGNVLYLLDEPTTGLHMADVDVLTVALRKLADKGNTLVCIEHEPAFIIQADWILELGPGSGNEGGQIVFSGVIKDLLKQENSATAIEIIRYFDYTKTRHLINSNTCSADVIKGPIKLQSVTTNNLKGFDVSFAVEKINAVCGVSGSGKSSLVYGSLFAECERRFMEGSSAIVRQYSRKSGEANVVSSQGLMPAVAIQKKNPVNNPRSVIATYNGLYDLYRMLYSRLAINPDQKDKSLLSSFFSFNHEDGACRECSGIGMLTVCDPDKLVTHPEKPLIAGALDGSKTGKFYGEPYGQYVAALLTVGLKFQIDYSVPYNSLTAKAREIAMFGCGEEVFDVDWNYKRGAVEGIQKMKVKWPGFTGHVNTEYIRKHADARGQAMIPLMKKEKCPECNGYRLKNEVLEYQLGGMHIGMLNALSAEDAMQWFESDFQKLFTKEITEKTANVLSVEIVERLQSLVKAGLGYISTDRIVSSLSGGEYQRLQLAGLVRAPLTGVTYILDEPSFGLHEKDISRISELITDLKNLGNTIVMVDHSPLLLKIADWGLLLGPGAGQEGGNLVASGFTPADYVEISEEEKNFKLKAKASPGLTIHGAKANNLKNIDLSIPAGMMTVISGVSGSGKTSLLENVIHASTSAGKAMNCIAISGLEHFSNVIFVEQSVPFISQNATLGSYTGLTEIVQKIFAQSDEAKKRNYKSSHFSRNTADGQCPVCAGQGEIRVSMDFFNDVETTCESCAGTGYKDEVLEVKVDGLSFYDVMNLNINDFSVSIRPHLSGNSLKQFLILTDLFEKSGLAYLSAGRLLITISTGELQRLKLVKGLQQKDEHDILFLLDEPTGGLHPNDIFKLLQLFNDLIIKGNTIICSTHEPMLIGAAGHHIELGPGGGKYGGTIVLED